MPESSAHGEHTMCVTADGYLLALFDLCLDHGWLLVDDFCDSQNNLEDVFSMDSLSVLESLDHVVDKV